MFSTTSIAISPHPGIHKYLKRHLFQKNQRTFYIRPSFVFSLALSLRPTRPVIDSLNNRPDPICNLPSSLQSSRTSLCSFVPSNIFTVPFFDTRVFWYGCLKNQANGTTRRTCQSLFLRVIEPPTNSPWFPYKTRVPVSIRN